MRETQTSQIIVPALAGVNQTRSEKLEEFATLQNLIPDQVGRLTRNFGKKLIEKQDGPIYSINQFWTAYGYSARVRQSTGGVVSDPQDPPDTPYKIPNVDYPVGCKDLPSFSNALKRQNITRTADYIHIRYHWSQCDGTDLDTRTALVACSIPGVPVYNGVDTTAQVGWYPGGILWSFDHGDQRIMEWADDNTAFGYESVVINLFALRKLAPSLPFTAKFQLRGYFFSYVNDGNVTVRIYPKNRTNTNASFLSTGTDFKFKGTADLPAKSWKGHIGTATSVPGPATGDHICYLYCDFRPTATNDKIWIDDV